MHAPQITNEQKYTKKKREKQNHAKWSKMFFFFSVSTEIYFPGLILCFFFFSAKNNYLFYASNPLFYRKTIFFRKTLYVKKLFHMQSFKLRDFEILGRFFFYFSLPKKK